MSLEVNTDIAVGELHSMTGWRNEVPKRVSKDGIHFILSILDGILSENNYNAKTRYGTQNGTGLVPCALHAGNR